MSEDWNAGLRLVAQAKREMQTVSEVQEQIASLRQGGKENVEHEIAKAVTEGDKKIFEKRRDEVDSLYDDLERRETKSKGVSETLRLIDDKLNTIIDASPSALQMLDTLESHLMEQKKLLDDRQQFDLSAKELTSRLKSLPSECEEAQESLTKATQLADDDKLDDAYRCLDAAELLIDKKTVSTAIKGELDEQFTKAVARMVGTDEGQKQLDQLVQSTDANAMKPETLMFLCESRFNLFSVDETNYQKGDSETTLLTIYKTLAKVPAKFTRTNPSLKTIQVTDPTAGGASYLSQTNTMTMKGRPGKTKKLYGEASGLPKDIDPACQLANTDEIDQFESSNLHETGHAVDDQLGFMQSKLDNPLYGSWQEHGGDLDDIAGLVVGKYGKQFEDVLKPWVIDLMTGHSTDKPVSETEDKQAFEKACKGIVDWHDKAKLKATPWYSQSKCDAITLGDRIYQESYQGKWTSYPAAERKKGVSGYQFRSPVEWFAELFAAYHQKKLKDSHPASDWLSKL